MKWVFKAVKKRSIKLFYNLDRKEGFVGMMLAIVMSVAIFAILSSVHIYTVNHARFQSGIKEAYVMQTDIENFAVIISSAYNKGRDGLTACNPGNKCCPINGIEFEFKSTVPCADPYKPVDVCIKSSGGREYCLAKLEKAALSTTFPTVAPPSAIGNPEAVSLKNCLTVAGDSAGNTTCAPAPPSPTEISNCNLSTSYGGGKSLNNLCQIVSRQNNSYPSGSGADQKIQECCNTYKLSVINCNKPVNQPSTCKGYETSSLPKEQKMWCEICEAQGQTSNPELLFTYYVCPKVGGNITDCVTKMAGTDKDKGESGVFYQTFRVLAH